MTDPMLRGDFRNWRKKKKARGEMRLSAFIQFGSVFMKPLPLQIPAVVARKSWNDPESDVAHANGSVPPKGAVAVIFIAMRSDEDSAGYEAAAARMDERAAAQPGFIGSDSVRGEDGLGITVSYWEDEACARAWKADAEHFEARAKGRENWYRHYRLIVSTVARSYDWNRAE